MHNAIHDDPNIPLLDNNAYCTILTSQDKLESLCYVFKLHLSIF